MRGGGLNVRGLMLIAGLTSMTMVSCSDTPTALSDPAKFTLVSGDAQSASAGALPTPLVVKVTDVEGNPKPGVAIAWSASDPTAVLSATTSTTDDQGQAQITWTIGSAAGRQTVTATTAAIPGAQVVFQATNTKPTQVAPVSGDAQIGNGSALPAPLVVKVTDAQGSAKAGVVVAWAASDPTATLSAPTSTTDTQGQAQVAWTLGASAGKQTVTATVAAVPGAPVVFQATNGGVLTGGVTVQSTPPVAFASVLGRAPRDAPSLRAARAAKALTEITRKGAARRLIVSFQPMAGASRIAIAAGARQANMAFMQRALASHLTTHRVSRAELSPAILAARVTVPEGANVDAAIAALRSDASVASVEIDSIVPMLQPYAAMPAQKGSISGDTRSNGMAGALAGVIPNDPFIPNALWHYNLVDGPRAWKQTTGSAAVLVAVVDNGIRYDHPSFPAGATSNLTHDGYNFVTGGSRTGGVAYDVCQGGTTTVTEAGPGPDPTQPDDLDYDPDGNCFFRSTVGNHGLHVAGTIGAPGNDGQGVTGLSWRVNIRPVRVLDITGSGSSFDIAQGVLYAAGLPASDGLGGTISAPSAAAVINMSLGGPSSTVMRNAVTAATTAGSLIVASAGNSASFSASFPAGYPEVLAVSAVGPDLSISSYTNVGGNVSLAAPGGDFRASGSSGVVSSTWDYVNNAPSYAYYTGTSMAAPHVAGVAALVLAASPGLTNTQLRARLQNTAQHVGASGRNDQYGYGLVNAYNAVTNTQGPTRASYVRVVNATTGVAVQTVATGADGSYSVSRLPAGSYFVYGGQDEDGDKLIGVPGRRFGWFGGAGGPTAVVIGNGTNASAAISIGTPIESKPHLTLATANRLVLNSYMIGQITATDGPAIFSFVAPAAGTYYFEAAAVLGSCNFGIELNTRLELLDAAGAVLASNNDIGATPTSPLNIAGSPFCSALGQTVTAGTTYYLRVSGSAATSRGQYRVWVRDQP